MNQQSVFQQILLAVVAGGMAFTTFAIVVIDEAQGRAPDPTALTMLSFVMGMASTLLGTHVGATIQAKQSADTSNASVTAGMSTAPTGGNNG